MAYWEEPFSREVYSNIQFYLQGVVYLLVGLFGIITNVINIIVFNRQGISSHSAIVSFTFLSAVNLYADFSLLLNSVTQFFERYRLQEWWYMDFKGIGFIILTQRMASTYASLTIHTYIAFERTICVMFPLKAQSLFTAKKALIINIVIVCIMAIMTSPTAGQYKFTWITYPYLYGNITYHYSYLRLVQTAMPKELIDTNLNFGVSVSISMPCILALCNIVIIAKVKISKKFRQSVSSSGTTNEKGKIDNDSAKISTNATKSTKSDKEEKLVNTILVMSLLYFMGLLCKLSYNIFASWMPRLDSKYLQHNYIYQVFYSCLTLIVAFIPTTNIFIYYKLSSRYKEEFRKLFGYKLSKK